MYRFLIPFLLIASSIAVYAMFISPGFVKMDKLKADQTILDDALLKKDQLGSILGKLEDVVSGIGEEPREKLERILPKGEEFDSSVFVNNINNIALNHNIVLESAKFSKSDSIAGDTNSPYGLFIMDFTVEAPYDAFIDFLRDLEESERLVDINYTSINIRDNDAFKYNVKLFSYWLK